MTLLRTQEFGRSSRQNSFLVTCTVSSKDPLPTDQVHVLISSGSHPEYTIEKDVITLNKINSLSCLQQLSTVVCRHEAKVVVEY